MAPRNVLGSPEKTFWIQHSLRNSTQLTPIVQLPGVEVDHHNAGVGPQERAVERGVLSRIGQALASVNHNDPIHLNSNHAHLHLITIVITASIRAPATITSCVFSLCSPLPPDCLSPWSVCFRVFPHRICPSYLRIRGD